MKYVYQVESDWSKELILAQNIEEAVRKYAKRNRRIDQAAREIKRVEKIGELSE